MNTLQLLHTIIIELKLIEDKYRMGIITGGEMEEMVLDVLKFYPVYIKK